VVLPRRRIRAAGSPGFNGREHHRAHRLRPGALAALFSILFAGVTFILDGLAVAWSRVYPRWLGWVVVAAAR